MRRLAFLVLPLFVLAACENGVPTAIDDGDHLKTAELVVMVDPVEPDALPVKVNLATATTIQLVVFDFTETSVPDWARAENGEYTDLEDHLVDHIPNFVALHYQDVGGDPALIDLVLAFEVEALFPPSAYSSTAAFPIDVNLNLFVQWSDDDAETEYGPYAVQLVYNAPKGNRYQGRP